MNRRALLNLLAGAATALASSRAFADGFPAKPIRLVVSYPPGAQTDNSARLVAARMAELLGQMVVIENRPGAGATIGAELVARSQADGYTLLMGGSSNLALAPLLYADLRYDPVRDFVAIGRIARVPFILAARSGLPVATLPQLLDHARARPGALTFASSSTGTQLATHMLLARAGVDAIDVPYKGTAPAVLDVVAGRVDFTFADYSAVAAHARAGTLRLLGTSGATRARETPEIPTIAELGFPGFSAYSWNAIMAPTGTPGDVVATLRSAVRRSMQTPAVRAGFEQMGFEPVDDDPEAFPAHLRAEIERLRRLVSETGIRVGVQ
jgi:tripartite-type tricarboxylate transporter receptor subunit TctC